MNLDQSFPSPADFAQYVAVDPNNTEVVRQRLYDFVLYPTAGALVFPMFSQPIGSGVGTSPGTVVGTTKGIWDTNLELASQLPQGKAFWIETIEVVFLPGLSAAANTFTPAVPAVFAAANAAAVLGQVNDVEILRQSGDLEFNISSKNYLTETPLGVFPPKTYNNIDGAVASTSATAGEVGFANAKWNGRPYIVEPAIVLQSGVNFGVNLKFPGLVATPSGFNGRIGVVFDGYLLRARQ